MRSYPGALFGFSFFIISFTYLTTNNSGSCDIWYGATTRFFISILNQYEFMFDLLCESEGSVSICDLSFWWPPTANSLSTWWNDIFFKFLIVIHEMSYGSFYCPKGTLRTRYLSRFRLFSAILSFCCTLGFFLWTGIFGVAR